MRNGQRLLAFVCLAVTAAWPTAARSDESESYVFRDVEPGATTADALRANDRWGGPVKEEQRADGSLCWTYQPRGYQQVVVRLHGGRVQTIDVYLPRGVQANEVAAAMKLGIPVEGAQLNEAAQLGEKIPESWEPVAYSAGRVVLFVDRQTNQARALRAYAAAVLGTAAAPAAPDESGTAPRGSETASSALRGQDAKSREIIAGVARVLPQNHISGHPLDREIGERTLGLLLDWYDSQRLYFLRDDTVRLRRQTDRFAGQLQQGDLSLVYDLFRTFLQRVQQREALVDELLDSSQDFELEEELVITPGKEPWAENELEIREAWRRRTKYELLMQLEAGTDEDAAREAVARRFHGVFDSWRKVTDDELLGTAADALFSAYDPRGDYYTPREFRDIMINIANQLVGIGASLQMRDGSTEVVKLIAGGPAEQDGRLQEGDRIVAVGQGMDGEMVDVTGMKLTDVVDKIRGSEGSTVRLRVIPSGSFEATAIDLVRAKFEVQKIGSVVLPAEQAGRKGTAKIGYVYLPTIYTDMDARSAGQQDYRSTARDMQTTLADMGASDVDVLVLDLRGNPGGSLTDSIDVAGQFVGTGPVLLARDGQGKVETYQPQTPAAVWDRPVVVVTDKQSSGGAEIIAAAVQDYRRGLVVGDSTTNGNGTVGSQHMVTELLYGSQAPEAQNDKERLGVARITTQKFYRPAGSGFQARGVTPDVVLPSLTDATGETQATQPYALQFDEVTAASFTPASSIDETTIQQLRQASEARRKQSDYFRQLGNQVQQLAARRERNAVPLHREKFLTYRRMEKPPDDDAPALSGIPDVKLTPYLKEVLAVALDYAAERHFAQAGEALAERRFGDALPAYRRALQADPAMQRARYKLAWSLATLPGSQWRNGKEAVEHAHRLCELDGRKNWSYLLTLAAAEAEAGNFDQAQKELAAALEKAPPDQRGKYTYLEDRFRNRQAFSSR